MKLLEIFLNHYEMGIMLLKFYRSENFSIAFEECNILFNKCIDNFVMEVQNSTVLSALWKHEAYCKVYISHIFHITIMRHNLN